MRAWDLALVSDFQDIRTALELPETTLALAALGGTAGASRTAGIERFLRSLVSSTTDEFFSVVQHLGLTERSWKWQARFQQLGLQARSEGAATRRSLRFTAPPVPHWNASVLLHSLSLEKML